MPSGNREQAVDTTALVRLDDFDTADVIGVTVSPSAGFSWSASPLNWVSLDPPLVETFAIITRDPDNVSPATRSMIDLVSRHMRMLHDEYEPGASATDS